MTQPSTPGRSSGTAVGFLVTLALLVVVLGWLFSDSFKPGVTLFSNDAPLGAHTADQVKTPGAFTGVWHDLNWLGANGGSYPADLTFGALYLLGPVGYSKFHAPLALLILGLSAWAMCTALGFRRPVAILTGLAAALNMNAFSNACWGLSCWPLAWAMSFLAVAAVAARTSVLPWVRLALAGLAVGMSVTEGADLGAIFSVTVGAFAFCHTLFSLGNGGKGIGLAVARVGVIGVFAGLMAFHIIDTLVFRAKVLDSVAAQKETMTPEQQWDWATQWSLPKAETLRILIPGLHGYRTDSPDATRYWGTAGRDPHWEMTHQGYSRFSGSGEYAGVLVVLLALFGLASAFRGKGGPLDPVERRMVAFWGAVAVVSLLFAWGRYAPFYRIVHATPYFSSFRNPIKWTQPFHFSVLMLFAFGLQALWRGYIEREPVSPAGFGAWWRKASGFDKNVVVAAGAFLGISLLFYLIYATSTSDLVGYMVRNAVASPQENPESVAREVAQYSQHQVGVYVAVLAISVFLLVRALTGAFAGPRAVYAAVLLGLVIGVNESRANKPWIVHYDYEAKYVTNPLFEYLRTRPGHERVMVAPFAMPPLSQLQQVYGAYWLQQQFPYFNIPSPDVIQDPRPRPENILFKQAFQGTNVVRLWELTSVRYMLGLHGTFADLMGQQLDGGRGRFRSLFGFELQFPGPGVAQAVTNGTGPLALIEFTGALPRANIYTKWEFSTNDEATLHRLADPAFDPAHSAIVSTPLTWIPVEGAAPGKLEMVSYAPKHIVLKTQAEAPAIVMLTDKHDPEWRVTVDGQPSQLLRCNYLMRGVQVPGGSHTVEFEFGGSSRTLFIGLGAISLGVVLSGILIAGLRRGRGES